MKKHKKFKFCILIGLLFIIGGGFFFCEYNPVGYRMTVGLRNFKEIDDKVYFYNGYSIAEEQSLDVVARAKTRVLDFFGTCESQPTIILCDDEAALSKLGGDHDTTTCVFGKVKSYIVISSKYLNVDILAHEMTHAEIHKRIYTGHFFNKPHIPIWFDEGLACQNDNREEYGEEAYKLKTADGTKNQIELKDIATAEAFYTGSIEDRRFHYTMGRHEVRKWIEKNGKDNLFGLLEKVRVGEDFNSLYSK